MKRSTYIIYLRGTWYALAMDMFCTVVESIDGRAVVDNVRTVADRNAAIISACAPLPSWRDAYNVARSAGNYIGQLVS